MAVVGALTLLVAAGCAHATPETPPQPEPVAATPPPSPAPSTKEPAPQTAAPEKPAAQTPTAKTPTAKTPAAKTPAAQTPAVKPPAAKTPTAKPTAPATAAAQKPAAQTPAAKTPAAQTPPLDLETLKAQLKATKAMGVFTKLTLKNQVDDLLDRFRAYYAGKGKVTLPELRQSYDLLLMKVLSLLQDKDQKLASDIVSSREAIWALLADRQKFAALPV